MFKIDKNKIEYKLWIFFTKVVEFIGVKRIPSFAKFLSFIFFYIIPIRKDVVIENLKRAFPEKSDNEIKKIAYRNFQSIGITFLEIMAIPQISSEEILKMVEFENLELAKDIINKKQGAILLTAHYANWELGALVMGLALNTQISVLVKKQRNRLVANWMSKMREQFTNKEVSLGVSVRELFRTLNNGGIIGIVGDQRAPKDDAVVVNFFNIPTYTFQGFSALGIKKRVPILVVLGERLKNGKYKVKISEINYENLPEDLSEQIKELNQRYMNLLENQIKKTPEQWLWMHKIWKY